MTRSTIVLAALCLAVPALAQGGVYTCGSGCNGGSVTTCLQVGSP